MSLFYPVVRQAVLQKKPIRAMYHGKVRLLCPHVIGWRDNREHVLCYQYGGQSTRPIMPPGSPDNWRCMFVDELRSVEVIDEPWVTAPIHTRPQNCVQIIDAQVH
jgi:hypothetical protein